MMDYRRGSPRDRVHGARGPSARRRAARARGEARGVEGGRVFRGGTSAPVSVHSVLQQRGTHGDFISGAAAAGCCPCGSSGSASRAASRGSACGRAASSGGPARSRASCSSSARVAPARSRSRRRRRPGPRRPRRRLRRFLRRISGAALRRRRRRRPMTAGCSAASRSAAGSVRDGDGRSGREPPRASSGGPPTRADFQAHTITGGRTFDSTCERSRT